MRPLAVIAALGLLLPVSASAEKYPVKKESVNPNYGDGELWDADYIAKGADSYMGWCRSLKETHPELKVVVDYKSFEEGFAYEMTHKKKVSDRVEAIAPWNPCDRLCSFFSFDANVLSGERFPSSQTKGITEEFQQKVTQVACVYRPPDAKGTRKTHIEYDPKTKTMTGFFTWSADTDWQGISWATRAYDTPLFQKEFPAVKKWLESH